MNRDEVLAKSDNTVTKLYRAVVEMRLAEQAFLDKLVLLNAGSVSLVITAASSIIAKQHHPFSIHLYSLFAGLGCLLASILLSLWRGYLLPKHNMRFGFIEARMEQSRIEEALGMKRNLYKESDLPSSRLVARLSTLAVCSSASGLIILSVVFSLALLTAASE